MSNGSGTLIPPWATVSIGQPNPGPSACRGCDRPFLPRLASGQNSGIDRRGTPIAGWRWVCDGLSGAMRPRLDGHGGEPPEVPPLS